jgi:predicted phosphodiesterase
MSTGKQSRPPEDPRSDLNSHCQHRPAPFSSSPSYDVQMLSQATLIGVMGDLHGDIEHALQAFKTLAERGVHVIVQLGDWGVLWPGRNWQIDLRKISRALARHQMAMYFLDGNHDWHPKIGKYPVDPDGMRWIANSVAHLPRGFRAQVGGFTLAVLGGANSIDGRIRKEGISWWPEDQITEGDLRRLGTERADILVGHEAPLMDEGALDEGARELGFSTDDIRYAAESRVMFRRAVLQTRPRLTLGAHYHHVHDQVLTVPGAAYPTRVVVLDMNGKDRVNLAILDTATLGLEFLDRNGAHAVPDAHEPERTDDGRPGS